MTGVAFEADIFRVRGRQDDAVKFEWLICLRRVAIGPGMELDDRRTDRPRRESSWAGSGSMNMETRIPASTRRRIQGAKWLCLAATFNPPSVVSSSRFSGTIQAAWGRWRKAMPSISSVAAISKFNGTVS